MVGKSGDLVIESSHELKRLRVCRNVLVLPAIEDVVHRLSRLADRETAQSAEDQLLLPCERTREAEAVRVAFGQFELQRVIPGIAAGGPSSRDRAKLRKRPERLSQGRTRRETRVRRPESASLHLRGTDR